MKPLLKIVLINFLRIQDKLKTKSTSTINSDGERPPQEPKPDGVAN